MNSNAKSILTFNGYEVRKISFSMRETDLKENETIDVNPSFMRDIHETEKNNFVVSLGVNIGREPESKMPFSVEIIISGYFTLKEDEAHADILIKQNATAILFPYLRSTLTSVTANANVNPVFLPAMNIANLFEESEEKEKTGSTQ